MGGYINISGNYRFEELGIIHVNVKSTARNVRARWKGGAIVVSAPTGIAYDDLLEILRGFAPKLESIRPETLYHIGQTLDFGEWRVTINEQSYKPDRMFAKLEADGNGHIDIGTDWELSSNDTIKNISQFLCRMAQNKAAAILLPRARDLADEVKKHPMLWTISNGHRVLGHCSADGVIALSYALLFYPHHLRDYVIYHELAHLSEMNHSPRFHEICDRYCGGREQQLTRELREYKIPIIK